MSEDLISRQASIDALSRTAREKFNLSDEFNHYLAGLMDGEMAIRNLPSVQERKKGKWLDKEVVDDRKDAKIQQWQQARCSICNKWHTTPYMYYFTNYNFCPNCGAHMEGAEE